MMFPNVKGHWRELQNSYFWTCPGFEYIRDFKDDFFFKANVKCVRLTTHCSNEKKSSKHEIGMKCVIIIQVLFTPLSWDST